MTVVTVIDRVAGDHPFVSALAADGIESEVVRVGAKSYLRELRSLRSLIGRLQPDIVHTHGYRSDVIGCLASLTAGTPRVTTVHGFTGGNFKNRTNEWLQVRAYHAFNAVVAVSRAISQHLTSAGVGEHRIHAIANAIDQARVVRSRADARARLGLSPDDFVIGWVGRMSAEKGPDVLVEALKSIKQPSKAMFIGDGPDRANIAARVAQLGLAKSVLWAGVVPDAASLFSAFDVFALSSRTEGIPIVLLEAMAAYVPIVAARVGGVPEMLDNTEALLVSADRPLELSDAISAVRDDPDAAHTRSLAARARLDRDFAVGPWVARYDAVYRSVLSVRAR